MHSVPRQTLMNTYHYTPLQRNYYTHTQEHMWRAWTQKKMIKSHIPSLICALACTQAQINTAASSLKCTSSLRSPLPGPVPVRTMAQNSQSAHSAGDRLSESASFPARLEMCLLYLYHYAALAASFTTSKQHKITMAGVQLQYISIACILSADVWGVCWCASVCRVPVRGVEEEWLLKRERGENIQSWQSVELCKVVWQLAVKLFFDHKLDTMFGIIFFKVFVPDICNMLWKQTKHRSLLLLTKACPSHIRHNFMFYLML